MTISTTRPRVHVLGLGSIGTFAAHCLAEIPPPLTPSVTLLFHRASLVDEYLNNESHITLETHEGETVKHGNYRLEFFEGNNWYGFDKSAGRASGTRRTDIIDNLIVSVKTPQTAAALRPLKDRLNASSHVLFLQNGSGMIEDVNKKVFTEESTRPNYITGVTSHGVTLNSPFNITHTGFAATSLGQVPQAKDDVLEPTPPSYLLQALPTVPRLNATSYTFIQVFQIQLEKLAVNAFCNPLCALNDAKNGFLFTIPETRHALLSEISRVVCALPELQGVSGATERFAVEKLETTCSMVVDLRRRQKTEIQFINGYWCRRGRELGVPTPLNDDLVRQILERQGDGNLAVNYQ